MRAWVDRVVARCVLDPAEVALHTNAPGRQEMENNSSHQENIHAVVGVGQLEAASSVVVEREHCARDSLLVAGGAINISHEGQFWHLVILEATIGRLRERVTLNLGHLEFV